MIASYTDILHSRLVYSFLFVCIIADVLPLLFPYTKGYIFLAYLHCYHCSPIHAWQGAGALKVVGPAGLKSYIELMTPFINRKYPELDVIEIDQRSSAEELKIVHLSTGSKIMLDIFPLCAKEVLEALPKLGYLIRSTTHCSSYVENYHRCCAGACNISRTIV